MQLTSFVDVCELYDFGAAEQCVEKVIATLVTSTMTENTTL